MRFIKLVFSKRSRSNYGNRGIFLENIKKISIVSSTVNQKHENPFNM